MKNPTLVDVYAKETNKKIRNNEGKREHSGLFRTSFIAFLISTPLSVITIIQAFRFDLRKPIELDFSLCYGEDESVATALQKLKGHRNQWDFYTININISCKRSPGKFLKISDQSRKNNTKRLDGASGFFEKSEVYLASNGTTYTTPQRIRIKADYIEYVFPLDSFAIPLSENAKFVVGNSGTSIKIFFPPKENYPYSAHSLTIEGMSDFIEGPYFLKIEGDGETGPDYILYPAPHSPEQNKAHTCNEKYGELFAQKFICSLMIN